MRDDEVHEFSDGSWLTIPAALRLPVERSAIEELLTTILCHLAPDLGDAARCRTCTARATRNAARVQRWIEAGAEVTLDNSGSSGPRCAEHGRPMVSIQWCDNGWEARFACGDTAATADLDPVVRR